MAKSASINPEVSIFIASQVIEIDKETFPSNVDGSTLTRGYLDNKGNNSAEMFTDSSDKPFKTVNELLDYIIQNAKDTRANGEPAKFIELNYKLGQNSVSARLISKPSAGEIIIAPRERQRISMQGSVRGFVNGKEEEPAQAKVKVSAGM